MMKFIDKTLPDDKVVDFARHIKHCPNCAEELEISYTLIIGMRQLDNNEDYKGSDKKRPEYHINNDIQYIAVLHLCID